MAAKKQTPKKPAAKVAATSAKDALKALAEATPIQNATSRKLVAKHANAQQWPSRNRKTGAVVALLDNRKGQITADADAKWYVACIAHSTLLPAPTVRLASHWRGHSELWCPTCEKEVAEKARVAAKRPRTDKAAEKDLDRKAAEAKAKPAAKSAAKPKPTTSRSKAAA
jgi:hypothetical protein